MVSDECISLDWSEQKDFSSMAEPIHYVSDPCTKCSRARVELLTDGDLVCEKCCWSQIKNEYRHDLYF